MCVCVCVCMEGGPFYLSEPYKRHVGGKKFATDADMKQAVTFWLQWTLIYIRPGYQV